MKLGILTNVVCNLTLDEALDYFKKLGLDAVEIGCGGTPGIHHCDPDVLLHDEEKFEAFRRSIQASGLTISAFSCHGNPVHPIPEIAQRYDHIMRNAVLMAEKMGVEAVQPDPPDPHQLPHPPPRDHPQTIRRSRKALSTLGSSPPASSTGTALRRIAGSLIWR